MDITQSQRRYIQNFITRKDITVNLSYWFHVLSYLALAQKSGNQKPRFHIWNAIPTCYYCVQQLLLNYCVLQSNNTIKIALLKKHSAPIACHIHITVNKEQKKSLIGEGKLHIMRRDLGLLHLICFPIQMCVPALRITKTR